MFLKYNMKRKEEWWRLANLAAITKEMKQPIGWKWRMVVRWGRAVCVLTSTVIYVHEKAGSEAFTPRLSVVVVAELP